MKGGIGRSFILFLRARGERRGVGGGRGDDQGVWWNG